MADVTQSVKNLETVLAAMGYAMPGHESGKMDPSFVSAFTKAREDLIRINGKPDGTPYTPALGQEILASVKENKDVKIGLMEAYSKGQDYEVPGFLAKAAGMTGTKKTHWTPAEAKAELTNNHFTAQLEEPKNIPGVIRFFNNADGYMSDITGISTELAAHPELASAAAAKPATAPAASKPPTGGGAAPARGGGGGTATIPAAARPPAIQAAASPAEEATKTSVKGLQKLINPGSAATGVPDAQFQGQLKDFIKTAQEKAGAGWTGPKDGTYTPAFQDYLNKSKDPAEMALGSALDAYKNAGNDPNTAPAIAAGAGSATPGTPGAAPAPASAPGTPPSTSEINIASQVVESFLMEVGKGINDKAAAFKEKSGFLLGMMMEVGDVPVPAAADDKFDSTSQASLQAILKTFQKKLDLTDDEIYEYSPETGQKILKNFGKLQQSMTPEQKAKLTPEKMEGIVGALDILARGNQLSHEKLYEGSPFKLTGMGASILGWVFNFIGKIFPSAQGFMNDMLKKFTGGYGYEDLVPKAKQDAKVVDRLYLNLPPEQRLKQSYIDAVAEAEKTKKPGETPLETRARVNDTLRKGLGDMMSLSGDEASNQAYKAAYEKAFAAADAAPDTESAAQAFADTFNHAWDPSAQIDPATGAPHAVAHPVTIVDPSVKGFKVDGENINAVIDLYEKQQKLDVNQGGKTPLFFKDAAGNTYAAGVTASNMFTVQKITPEALKALNDVLQNNVVTDKGVKIDMNDPKNRAIAIATLRENYPALEMLGAYGDKMGPEQIKAAVDGAKTFADVRRPIDERYANERADRGVQDDIAARNAARTRARDARLKAYGQPEDGADPTAQRFEGMGGATRRGVYEPPNAGEINSAGNMIAMKHEVDQKLRTNYISLSRPSLLTDDFVNRGALRVVIAEDTQGIREVARGNGLNRALVEDKFFTSIDITDEYKRFNSPAEKNLFEDGFKKFCEKNANLSSSEKLRKYNEEYQNGLEARYPKMASIVRNPEYTQGGVHYSRYYVIGHNGVGHVDIAGLSAYIGGQIGGLDDTKFRHAGPGGEPEHRSFWDRIRGRHPERNNSTPAPSGPAPIEAAPPLSGGANGCPPGGEQGACEDKINTTFGAAKAATDGTPPPAQPVVTPTTPAPPLSTAPATPDEDKSKAAEKACEFSENGQSACEKKVEETFGAAITATNAAKPPAAGAPGAR